MSFCSIVSRYFFWFGSGLTRRFVPAAASPPAILSSNPEDRRSGRRPRAPPPFHIGARARSPSHGAARAGRTTARRAVRSSSSLDDQLVALGADFHIHQRFDVLQVGVVRPVERLDAFLSNGNFFICARSECAAPAAALRRPGTAHRTSNRPPRRFRERDDLADRGFRRHEGDDPIEAERDATMWRRAVSSASRKNPKRMRASSSLMLSREKIRRCSVES